jgi:anti-sigma regulatory factor (Ser/Thr protein kinase)
VLTDLALGVDEALVLLVGHASNHPPGANGTVELRCHVTDGALEVTVELLGGVGRPAAEAIERCRTLVTGAVSQASVRADGLAVAFSVTTWAG